jgi:hypothetical protein
MVMTGGCQAVAVVKHDRKLSQREGYHLSFCCLVFVAEVNPSLYCV